MTNASEINSNSRLRAVAVILGSLIIVAPLLTGKVVEAVMDSTNPAGLADVTVPLAYLSEILIASFVVMGVVVVAFIGATIALYLRERTAKAVALPLIVGILHMVVGAVLLVMEQVVSSAAA